ncbi:MAG: NDP-sugar synthase [Nitrospina sp.]|jgi:NDP-sugar pyrophosphorylase family protein|nr:NDP-sugar synthase [Nitrospina sp.]MBT6601489.1 NDP-sugar synthase [Nitrospina sp.]
MKAMVLAAGFGNRLQPLTRLLPKPMFPVLGRPLLSHTFDLLESANINDIVVNIHHLPNAIINYFNNTPHPNINIRFSHEKKILGTAGGIKKMAAFLEDGPFVLINSDIVTDIKLDKVIDFHNKNNSKLTLVVRQDISPEQYDSIEICKDGRIVHFVGASSMNIPSNTKRVMFTGIQIIEPDIFKRIPAGQFCGTTEDIYPQMIRDEVPIFGYLHDGYWKDMGNRKNYLQVNSDALNNKVSLKGMPAKKITSSFISPPILVGHNCDIAVDAKLGPHSVIGPNCRIKSGALVENSILWEGVTIGIGSTVKNSVIVQNKTIGDYKSIKNESIT